MEDTEGETQEDSGFVVVVDGAVDAGDEDTDDEPDSALAQDSAATFDADVDIDAGEEPDAQMVDAASADAASDAALNGDSGGALDSGTSDSGVKLDAGTPDSGAPDAGAADSGIKPDSGTPDAGALDSGIKPDSGIPDAGALDSGAADSGIKLDSGPPDSGAPDAGGALDSGASDAAIDAGPATTTFTAAYAVISANCLGCHGSGNGSGNLQMGTKARAYDELVGGPLGNPTGAAEGQCLASGKRRVIAFDAPNSLLIQKLIGISTCGNSIMPPNSGGIGSSQIAIIQAWIAAGALND